MLYPTASERGECMLAMLLFWVLAALAVVGALAMQQTGNATPARKAS